MGRRGIDGFKGFYNIVLVMSDLDPDIVRYLSCLKKIKGFCETHEDELRELLLEIQALDIPVKNTELEMANSTIIIRMSTVCTNLSHVMDGVKSAANTLYTHVKSKETRIVDSAAESESIEEPDTTESANDES